MWQAVEISVGKVRLGKAEGRGKKRGSRKKKRRKGEEEDKGSKEGPRKEKGEESSEVLAAKCAE